MDMLIALIGAGILLWLYCLPGIVSTQRHHRNAKAIIALNLLTGWTLIGWVLSLVWSLTDNTATAKI